MTQLNAGILGMGHAYPAGVLTNADLEKMVETSDEWITSRTGIKTRRIAAKDEHTSDMAARAALAAMERYSSLISGTVELRLYKGNVIFEGATGVERSLYAADDASMERAGSFDHTDAEGFLRVLGVPARNFANRLFPHLGRSL